MQLLNLGPARLRVVEFFSSFARMVNKSELVADLLIGSSLVDASDDLLSLLHLSVPNELSW